MHADKPGRPLTTTRLTKSCVGPSGLAAVGVALVASSAKQLTHGTCKDRTTMIINAGAAVIAFYHPVTWIFPTLILIGGLITLVNRRKEVTRVLAVHSTSISADHC